LSKNSDDWVSFTSALSYQDVSKITLLVENITIKSTWTHALIPARSFFVRGCSSGVVSKLDFVQLGKILLVSGCTTEAAFATVMCDGFV
jgi:hypothetical protein